MADSMGHEFGSPGAPIVVQARQPPLHRLNDIAMITLAKSVASRAVAVLERTKSFRSVVFGWRQYIKLLLQRVIKWCAR